MAKVSVLTGVTLVSVRTRHGTRKIEQMERMDQVNEALAVLTRQTVPTLMPKASTD